MYCDVDGIVVYIVSRGNNDGFDSYINSKVGIGDDEVV